MENLKKKVEALLFSSGRKMSLDELTRLCNRSLEDVINALNELKKEFEEKKSSLMIVNEGDYWKLTTKEEYLHLVKNIVTKTELTKTLMETLAVIAFKYPIKQSDLIKIRTNKAYDHLKELEEMGYITRQKYGRTKLIKLTQKFFDYFSLPQDKLKEQFKDFSGLSEAIEAKEKEIKKIQEEQRKRAKEAGKKVDLIGEKGKVELEVIDEPQEEPEEEKKPKVKAYKDKLGELEVIDEPKIKPKEAAEKKKEEPKGIELTDEMEEKVDERVNEILGLKSEKGKTEAKEEPTPEETEVGKQIIKEAMQETIAEREKTEEMSDVDKKIDELFNPKEEKEEKLEEIDESKWGQEEKEDILSEEPKNKEEQKIKDFPTSKSEDFEEPKDLLEAAFEEKEKKEKKKE